MIDIVCNAALDGFPCGYWSPTYKDLYEVWKEVKRVLEPVTKRKDEQVKQIELITGGKVDFWSLEEPDSGRGRKYKVSVNGIELDFGWFNKVNVLRRFAPEEFTRSEYYREQVALKKEKEDEELIPDFTKLKVEKKEEIQLPSFAMDLGMGV